MAYAVRVLQEVILLKRIGPVALAGLAGKAYVLDLAYLTCHVMISTIIFTLNLFE
jgi:hypothetical protein